MELDWTTVVLEAINFLVLVWLLKRFFYRPVLDVIAARKAETERIVASAEQVRSDATAMKDEYARKLAAADHERVLAQERLDAEIAAERTRRLAAVATEAEAEQQRRAMLAERELRARSAALEHAAVAIAARFAARLLDRLASPELETKLVDLALAELDAADTTQTPERLASLVGALHEAGTSVEISTAFPLDAHRRAALVAALEKLGRAGKPPAFREDATLKAGLRITAGAWVLMANLRDDLAFFNGALKHDQ